jgi:uncharacterized protein YndB with AHSA1/START domain
MARSATIDWPAAKQSSRDLVLWAYTDADLIARWWGPKRLMTFVDKLEARPGGQ